jgi:hypothetical protein
MTRTRTLIIATGIAAAAVGGGAAIALAQEDPGPPDLDRAAHVAVDAVGGGDVVGVEQDDDGTYDVDVRRADASAVEVEIDGSFAVTRTEDDTDDADDDDRDDAADDRDDVAVDDAARERAAQAALAEVGDAVVVAVEGERDGYDVELRRADGSETEVHLDASFAVVGVEHDDD